MKYKSYLKLKLRLFCSKNRFFTFIYFIFFNKIYVEEFFQLINGVSNFKYESDVYLRREIHRLEKALCMPIKKEKYSVSLANIIIEKLEFSSPNTKSWGIDVLSKYYIENKNKIWINEVKFKKEILNLKPEKIPFKYKIKNYVTYEQLSKQFLSRRSVRWYSKKKISPELYEKIITESIDAPSACNRIPFKFYTVLNNNEKASKIANVAAGTSGYSEQISNLIIITGDLSSYENEKDRHAIYIDSSLAVMNLIHLFQVNEIGSCCINWSEDKYRDKEIRDLVKLKSYEKIVMLLSFGYVDENSYVPYSQKKLFNEVVEYVD